jgi:hypothetical protein
MVDRPVSANRLSTVRGAPADRIAGRMLERVAAGGRRDTVETVPLPWLMPGHTVIVDLGDGLPVERHLVADVDIPLTGDTMTVTTVEAREWPAAAAAGQQPGPGQQPGHGQQPRAPYVRIVDAATVDTVSRRYTLSFEASGVQAVIIDVDEPAAAPHDTTGGGYTWVTLSPGRYRVSLDASVYDPSVAWNAAIMVDYHASGHRRVTVESDPAGYHDQRNINVV